MSFNTAHGHVPEPTFSALARIASRDLEISEIDLDSLNILTKRGLVLVYDEPCFRARYAALTEDGWRRLRAKKRAPARAGWELDVQVAEQVLGSETNIETWKKGFAIRVRHDPAIVGDHLALFATIKTVPGIGSPVLFHPSRDGALALKLLEIVAEPYAIVSVDLRLADRPTAKIRFDAPEKQAREVEATGDDLPHAICRALIEMARQVRREQQA
ncbi:hypothetical protein CKO28_00075 [Rhodovibrio sodomensis]|uniref:Uncharacterized protein n=1 Tax=Rhodovibrio sodomensis TaxID=1088 RepID=A0ABS1D7W5_9PROT|nr:hypothetical protein [Rhodovibrio sodomensis]MBK1666435.1 hypothetical protein [Rhodovibrio sodomensis]